MPCTPRAALCSFALLVPLACLLPCALHCKADRGAKPVIELPVVDLPGSNALQPATRIVVTANGIDVDNSAVVDSWPREKREAFISSLDPEGRESVPLVEHEVVKLSSGRITGVELLADWPGLRPLSQVLEAAWDIERRFRQETASDPPFVPRVAMAIEGSVPYETVARVQSLVGQLGLEECSFQVRRADGTIAELPACAPRGRLRMGCQVPRMTVVDTGLAIEIVDREEKPGPVRRQVVGPSTECPSIPRRNGRFDAAKAGRLLDHFDLYRACPEALIGAEASRSWAEVAQMAAAAVRAGRTVLDYFVATPEFARELSRCQETVVCPGPTCPSNFRGAPVPTGGRPPVPRPPR